jgi:hypothetical protein
MKKSQGNQVAKTEKTQGGELFGLFLPDPIFCFVFFCL